MTFSSSYTYTVSDIESVVRRFTADIVMIAQSSGAITEAKARDYAHDVQELAKDGYIAAVDLTLFSGTTEAKAAQYVVSTDAGALTMNRPGGVMWPRVNNPSLRVILSHTSSYDAAAEEAIRGRLRIAWSPTSADTNHPSLSPSGTRAYASNGWGMQRTDYSA